MKNLKYVITIYISIFFILFLITSCSFVNEKQIENEPGLQDGALKVIPTVDNETGFDEGLGGTEDYCIHDVVSYHIPGGFEYDGSYHAISGDLIQQVGFNEFDAWTKITNDNLELSNIVEFVKYFEFDKLLFQSLINTKTSLYYRFDYNIDVIYSEDTYLIEKYYTSGMDRIGDIITKKYLLIFKNQLYNYLLNEHKDEFNKWVNEKNLNNDWKYCELSDLTVVNFDGNIRQWSISEVVTTFNIPKEVVEKVKNETEQAVSASCTFDIELLYNENKRVEIENELLSSTNFPNIDPVLYDIRFINFDSNKQVEIWNNNLKEYSSIG